MNAEPDQFQRIREIGQANLPISQGGSPPRILIVDDSPTIRYSLKKDLEQMGAIVTEATNGREGLSIAESLDFDLIITDVEMPRMDGFTFCAEIKKHPAKHSIPVVILSSREKEEDIEYAFKVGASNYITKSNARQNIRVRVKEILDRHSFLNGRTVLVVDDSAAIRNLIGKALGKAGFQVILAENGQQALDLLDRHSPDMVLSDLHMPVLDGLGLCKAIHGNRDFSQIPFIIMSPDDDRAKMRQLLEYGASAYLVKPFNIDQLVVTAERFLSDHFNRVLRDRKHLEAERQILIASISSLVLALEKRDHYTSGHSESVAALVADIACEMSMDEGRIEMAKMAGKLHDLGKIGIRDDILLKPGPLNEEEWKILKLHPSIGADILAPIESLSDIIPGIRSHHERIDGKGYPEGLKGGQIHLLARMIAVADTYDALKSDRPYRKGFSKEDALEIIEKAKGSQLCPECVQSFMKALELKSGSEKREELRPSPLI